MDFEHELQRIAETYRDQGYTVTLLPNEIQLPPFARDFAVEIAGQRGTEGVLVAVKRSRDDLAADTNVQRYAEVTGSQPGWRFDFAILESEKPMARELQNARDYSASDIAQSLNEAERLVDLGFSRAAVIAAWAALEAAMRMRLRVAGQEAGWGSVSNQMVKELYSAGDLSPDEFQVITSASQLRNQIVHGFSYELADDQKPDTDVHLLSDIARRLVSESQQEQQAA